LHSGCSPVELCQGPCRQGCSRATRTRRSFHVKVVGRVGAARPDAEGVFRGRDRGEKGQHSVGAHGKGGFAEAPSKPREDDGKEGFAEAPCTSRASRATMSAKAAQKKRKKQAMRTRDVPENIFHFKQGSDTAHNKAPSGPHTTAPRGCPHRPQHSLSAPKWPSPSVRGGALSQ
jgi:hypothetical protein